MSFFRKVTLEVMNLLFNNRLAFAVAKQFRIFDAVFVMYPADHQFADHFTFRARQLVIRWRPFVTGIVRHPSGKRTLMFAVSSFVDEKDRTSNVEKLRILHDRVTRVQKMLGAASTHFAGTLPGRFTALRIRRGENQKNERRATQENVLGAIFSVRQTLSHNHENPVIILGSKGFIGKEVVARLQAEGMSVIAIDQDTPYNEEGLRYKKPNKAHIIVNITAPEAVNEYVDPLYMGKGTTLLNEVYPAPHGDVVHQMKELGVTVLHIAGVMADVTPLFPGPYEGALPCCAALPGEEYHVKIVEL